MEIMTEEQFEKWYSKECSDNEAYSSAYLTYQYFSTIYQQEIEQLKAEKQAIVSEDKPDQMEHESNNETRRKILLGSYLDKKMSAKEANKEKILSELNVYLTEDRDRQLFDLPLISETLENPLVFFEKAFKSYEIANIFCQKFVTHFGVFNFIRKSKDLWILTIRIEEFGEHYIELADIFYNPSFEEINSDEEDHEDDEELDLDFDSDRKVTDVGLNGYPRGYDTSLTNRY